MQTKILRASKHRLPAGSLRSLAAPRQYRFRRKGISALWAIMTIPISLVVLGGVIHIGNLWLARVELENALEAAALAAVKEWGDAGGGATQGPREVGVAYASANTVRRAPVEISTNLDPDPAEENPNENLTCRVGKGDPANGIPPTGNLIFGAITDEDPQNPVTFNAGIAGGCLPAKVFIDITKPDAGSPGANASTNERMFGIFYEEGPPNVSIRSISFTMPVFNVQVKQQPYFDRSKAILVSDSLAVMADELNRFNPEDPPKDVRGLDPDPVSGADDWICPAPPPPVQNPDGDICFTVSDQVACNNCGDDRFRTLTINFKDGAFSPPSDPNDPDTVEFVRFGASVNQLNPPALPPGTKNDGEAFHKAPVRIFVTFYDSSTNDTKTFSAIFVDDDDPDNGRAIVTVGGGSEGALAVRAQAIVNVPVLFGKLFGYAGRKACLSACTTAMYDCETRRPRLIRVDRFICPGPQP